MTNHSLKHKSNQEGSIMIYTILILVSLITLSGVLLKLFIPKLHAVKEAVYSADALYAADSATEWCLYGQKNNMVFGNMTIGTQTDTGDSNASDMSRFISPNMAGTTVGIGIYVVSPVDSSPFNQFQMALYADDGQPLPASWATYNRNIHSNPTTRLAVSSVGTLTANSWNMVSITASVSPSTIYWIGYNSNGRNATLNNFKYTQYAAPGVPPAGGFDVWDSGVTYTTWNNPFPVHDGGATIAPSNFVVYANPPVPNLAMSNGATFNIYAGASTNPNLFCAKAENLDYRIVGLYRGIARSFQIFQ